MLVVLKVVNNYDFNSSAQSLDLIFNLFIYFIYIHVSSYLKKIDLTSSNFTLIRKIKKRSNQRYNAYFLDPIMLCIFYLKILIVIAERLNALVRCSEIGYTCIFGG